jgi:hypothetical protein
LDLLLLLLEVELSGGNFGHGFNLVLFEFLVELLLKLLEGEFVGDVDLMFVVGLDCMDGVFDVGLYGSGLGVELDGELFFDLVEPGLEVGDCADGGFGHLTELSEFIPEVGIDFELELSEDELVVL